MIQAPVVYTDFRGLQELEAGARERRPEVTREAARQFEGLFVEMMLKSMREATAILAEDRDRTYEEMFDHQIALELTREKGIGLAELMLRQLGQASGRETGVELDPSLLHSRIATRAPASAAAPGAIREDFRPDGPESFLERIWPLAQRAGRKLGVAAEAIAAQAALETGWGQRLIRDADGISGNNLFGIKADARWPGERLQVASLEYEGGLPRLRRAAFRAYQNLREGFDDYVNFLRDNPRYAEALRAGRDPAAFAHSLQAAGYATDPRYAGKMTEIMASPRFTGLVSQLKTGGTPPTS